MSVSRRYRAFISYSHSDARVAVRLHRRLEGYRVPTRLRGAAGEFGAIPERLSPIFRDREDLATAGDVRAHVREALAESDALIVICSPAAAKSRWVNEEVLAFKRGGRGDRIYCLIVAGEPNAGDERECFPPALRFQIERDGEIGRRCAEPIAADMRPGMDGHVIAKLKLIAGLLGVDLDTLRQREAQRRHRRMLAIVVASLTGMTMALALAATAWIARNDARQQQARAEIARKDAQRRQAQAEDLLGFMLDDLRPKLEKVGRLDLLDTVNDQEMRYFAGLDPRDLSDVLLARQAQALTQIGQVRLSQARFPEALASFQSAYLRSKALADRRPGDGKRLFDRGQAEYYLGYVYWQSRDLHRARLWLTRYRDTSREAYAIDPRNIDWKHEVAYGDHNLAVLDFEGGELLRASEGFARARSTLESILARTPGDLNMIYEVADEVSWQGSVEEQRGNLPKAETLLARKTDAVRRIVAAQPNDLRWKYTLSTSELMLSDMLRIRGEYTRAETLADGAAERMKMLTTHDPDNKDWSGEYLRALILRAAARIGSRRYSAANDDLARTDPLLEASMKIERSDRYVRRNLLDALSLRSMRALQRGDRRAAQREANALHSLCNDETALDSAETAGRIGLCELISGMAAEQAGRSSAADAHFAAARRTLAGVARNSGYWRILDPWARLCVLTGDLAEAKRVEAQLNRYGYVALFPWPLRPWTGRIMTQSE